MKYKSSYIVVIVIGLITLIGIVSFTTIFLYKRNVLDFLAPLYLQFDEPPPDVDYTRYDNLALFYEANNSVPEMRVQNNNISEFLEWKKEAINQLKNLLGILNNGVLDEDSVKEISSEKTGKVVLKEISFTTYDGIEIPCYLFVHDDDKKRPAVIIISGHGKGIVETAGIVNSYQNSNAKFLAEHGFITLTCENRGIGKLNRIHHAQVFANAVALGRSYQGVILDDQMEAVSLLETIENVDKDRIGAAGVSLGGEQVMYLAAIDERIKAAAVFGWLSDYKVLMHRHTANWAVPGIMKYFDEESVASLIAPRPVLYSNGAEESKMGPGWFNTDDALETMIEINKTYELFPDSYVEYKEHPRGHIFDNNIALKFFKEHL